jgi:RIO-like serine/threonine protein kinase
MNASFKIISILLSLGLSFPAFAPDLKLAKWKKGDTIKTPEGRKLKIIDVIEDGHKALVYRAKDQDRDEIALKVAISNDPDILKSLKGEPLKIPDLDASGVEYAEIFEHGGNYMVKEWVEGIRGDKWFEKWEKKGSDTKDPVFQKLLEMYHDLADQGIYIGNLKPLNVIFDGKKWVVVDPGSFKTGLKPSAALKEFEDTLTSRWKMSPKVAKAINDFSKDSDGDNKKSKNKDKDSDKDKSKAKDTLELSSFREGGKLKTPGGMKLKLKRYIDTGRRGAVWKAVDEDGNEFAVKVARNNNPDTLASIKEEPKRTKSVADVGLPIAAVVESGKNYLIKDWIDGERGDAWFKKWVKDGANPKDSKFRALMDLFEDLSKRGIYIGDLNRKNLTWTKKGWQVIESGAAHPGQDKKKILKRYHEKFYELWTRDVDCPKLIKILGLKK